MLHFAYLFQSAVAHIKLGVSSVYQAYFHAIDPVIFPNSSVIHLTSFYQTFALFPASQSSFPYCASTLLVNRSAHTSSPPGHSTLLSTCDHSLP